MSVAAQATVPLPDIDAYLRKAEVILAGVEPADRNTLIDREIEAWERRFRLFCENPRKWKRKYPTLSMWDFSETILGLARLKQ